MILPMLPHWSSGVGCFYMGTQRKLLQYSSIRQTHSDPGKFLCAKLCKWALDDSSKFLIYTISSQSVVSLAGKGSCPSRANTVALSVETVPSFLVSVLAIVAAPFIAISFVWLLQNILYTLCSSLSRSISSLSANILMALQ